MYSRIRLAAIPLALVIALASLLSAPTVTAQSAWSPPTTVYVSATGHSIDGVFLDVWRAWGGAASFGNPITEELTDGSHVLQYYEYARFEYWPEGDASGNVVHFGDLGAELLTLQLQDLKNRNEAATSSLTAAIKPVDPKTISKTSDRLYVPASKHTVQLGFRNFWEATGEAAYLGNPITEEYRFAGRSYQFFERGQLWWDAEHGVRMVDIGRQVALREKLDLSPAPQGGLPSYSEALFVPPPPAPVQKALPNPNAERWIEVNLSTQYLIAWQGDVSVLESYVSTGRPGFETPTGTFHVLTKLESQTMAGVIGGESYYVPDVPWVMYFTNQGHALHGTYWHNNFGHVMSHGCVNLPMDVAEWLYAWTPIGARVEIHY